MSSSIDGRGDDLPTLRVGVIGLGVGARHAAAYARTPGCRLAAVCDRDEDARERAYRDHPETWVTQDAAALVAAPGIDAISIASHDDDHADQVLVALATGRHVFVEKPLCRRPGELHRIAAALRVRPDLVLASNLVLRAAPLWRRVRSLVRSGALGEVYAIDGDYLYGRLHKLTHGWRGRTPGYSVMLGGGVHLVDLIMWVLGQRPETVQAAGTGIASRETAFDGHDFAAATYRFPSGAVGRVTANFAAVTRHQHVVRVFGTAGTVIVDDRGARLLRHRDPGGPETDLLEAPAPDDKGALIPDFVAAARGSAPADPGRGHELAVIAACLAAEAAVSQGSEVAIDYPDDRPRPEADRECSTPTFPSPDPGSPMTTAARSPVSSTATS